MSGVSIEDEVRALERLDLYGLREVWDRRYGDPPPLRSPGLLRCLLAWRIQVEAFGGLDPALRRRLRRKGAAGPDGLNLGVGARIKREWRGGMVEVEVTATGFLHDGQVYPSLSAAATAIAGTKWNGPRFFGLRGKAA